MLFPIPSCIPNLKLLASTQLQNKIKSRACLGAVCCHLANLTALSQSHYESCLTIAASATVSPNFATVTSTVRHRNIAANVVIKKQDRTVTWGLHRCMRVMNSPNQTAVRTSPCCHGTHIGTTGETTEQGENIIASAVGNGIERRNLSVYRRCKVISITSVPESVANSRAVKSSRTMWMPGLGDLSMDCACPRSKTAQCDVASWPAACSVSYFSRRTEPPVPGDARRSINHRLFHFYNISPINPLDGKANYRATSNNMKSVHWPLVCGLLHLVQWEGDWVGPQAAQALHRCSVPNATVHLSTASVPITALLHYGPLFCDFN